MNYYVYDSFIQQQNNETMICTNLILCARAFCYNIIATFLLVTLHEHGVKTTLRLLDIEFRKLVALLKTRAVEVPSLALVLFNREREHRDIVFF